MSYQQITTKLKEQGYQRVERDDRLFDVFPTATLEKGIELWERWDDQTVHLARLHEPQQLSSVTHYQIPRLKLEAALTNNQTFNLAENFNQKS